MIVPNPMLEELVRKDYPGAHCFLDMLAGDVPEDARETIEHDLQLYWSEVTLDTITTALLVHYGINPAVLGHAASKVNPMAVWNNDTRPLALMTWRGDTQIHLGSHATWMSATRIAGAMHHCDDMEGGRDQGAFAVPLLPGQVTTGLAGRPLREILSHPALDSLGLTITEAANHEFFTHLRTDRQTPVRRRDLTALLA